MVQLLHMNLMINSRLMMLGLNYMKLISHSKISYQKSLDGKEFLEIKIKEFGIEAENSIIAIKQLPGNYQDIKNDIVGSQIGEELRSKGIKSMILALLE